MLTETSDKLLFTPGPLTTSRTVKEAMVRDLGSRDYLFIELVKEIRNGLLTFGGVSEESDYTTILMQGSGTFGVEATVTTAIPRDGHLLVLINGAYGERIAKMARIHGIGLTEYKTDEDVLPDPQLVKAILEDNQDITHVAIVHCETTTGIINPIAAVGQVVKETGRVYIVDAMSSFGAVPVDILGCQIDYLVSSSNKCIEGVPGFSFTIARKSHLDTCKGNARSLTLDLYEQWKGLEANGQFRFTPPIQAMLAFHQAMQELREEGGVEARGERYKANRAVVRDGMRALGFKEYLDDSVAGYIITSYLYPEHPQFVFETFYKKLSDKGFAIYPGKLSKVDCFRIGNIGRLYEEDMHQLIQAIKKVLQEMDVSLV